MSDGNQRHHLFVSYASVDNQPMPGVEKGRVTELVRGLKTVLAMQLGRKDDLKLWMDYELRGNDAITPTIEEALDDSELLLLILSPGHLASSWCRKELERFLERHAIDDGRIFLVEFEPAEKPDALHDLKGFRFHEKSPEGELTKLGWPKPNPEQHPLYYQRVDDLAYAIADRIKALDETRDDAPPPPDRTVLLAPVTDDLIETREAMRRFLEQQRIAVLPEKGYYPPDALVEPLKADLAEADLYVQLISEAFGAGLPAHYHRLAAESGRPRLLWHAPTLNPESVANGDHRALFNDETLIVSELTELRDEVLKALKPEPEKPPLEGKLFIHHAPEDEHHMKAITTWLADHDLRFNAPLPSGEEIPVQIRRKDLEHNLFNCEQLLFLHCDADEEWLEQQFVNYRMIRVQREEELKAIGLCRKAGHHGVSTPPEITIFHCDSRDVTRCLELFVTGGRP